MARAEQDLFDLYLIVQSGQLSPTALPPAVEIAFSSRGYPLSRLLRLVEGRFGTGPSSRRNWARWRAGVLDKLASLPPRSDVLDIPAEPIGAVRAITPVVVEVLRQLGYAALQGDAEAVPVAPKWKVECVDQIIADARTRLVSRSPTVLSPQRDGSATAPAPEAYFIISGANRTKWEESCKVLAEWADLIVPSEYVPPRALRFPPGLANGSISAEEAARRLVLHCHEELRKPCIVDLVYLELYGVGYFHLLPASEELKFAKDHAGQTGVMHAVVCYCDEGGETQVFTGELEGTVVYPVRGDRPYGFNRAWLPDGYTLTLGEMRSSFFAVHPRLKPMLELAASLRSETAYGTLECAKGLFELHVTVRTPTEEQGGLSSFQEACSLCGVKAVWIENESGDVPTQVMTASYVKGTLTHVHHEAFRLSQRLLGMGFIILRVKIESTFSNRGVPVDDAEAAALSPHNYFEFHWKLRLGTGYDHSRLMELTREHAAHLSRSALRKVAAGFQHRFVTLRLYDMGRRRALERASALTTALRDKGYEILSILREYAVYDSNVGLDAGWIEASGGPRHMNRNEQPHPPTYIEHTPVPCLVGKPEKGLHAGPHMEAAKPEPLGQRIRRLLWSPVHPLMTTDLPALVAQLRQAVSLGLVSVQECGPAEAVSAIYHYRNIHDWTDALLLARGVVLYEPRGCEPRVLATPFPKFFDLEADGIALEELYAQCVRWEATEKLDGSMGILFHHHGDWTLITKRAWRSAQAEWGRAWLEARHVRLEALDVGATYICEIIFAANLVVVNYEASQEGVILCGAIGKDGVELDRSELERASVKSGLPLVQLHASGIGGAAQDAGGEEYRARLSVLHDLRKEVQGWPGQVREGVVLHFVLRSGAHHRAKLKSDSYKELYRLQDSCTERSIWAAVRTSNGAVDELRKALPPQFKSFFEKALHEVYESAAQVIASAHRAVELAPCEGEARARRLSEFLQTHTSWADGSKITQAQRKLAHKALAGRLGHIGAIEPSELHPFGPTWGSQAAAYLERLGAPTRHAVFAFVPVPSVAPNGFVTTADGVELLNHRR